MNRILFKEHEIDGAGIAHLTDIRARHVLEVLHGKPGQEIRIGVINGALGEAVIVDIGASSVTLDCALSGELPPVPKVDLLLALPRPKVMRRLWAQLAALGVGHIVITNAEKVERNYFDTQWLESRYYEPLLVEGLMQSGDTWMPGVTMCRRFKVFVEDSLDDVFAGSSRFVCHPGGAPAVRTLKCGENGRMLIAIGPEGGWSDYEVELLRAYEFEYVSIGTRILRSDTACVAALSLANGVMQA